jgi:hypothetical protein
MILFSLTGEYDGNGCIQDGMSGSLNNCEADNEYYDVYDVNCLEVSPEDDPGETTLQPCEPNVAPTLAQDATNYARRGVCAQCSDLCATVRWLPITCDAQL